MATSDVAALLAPDAYRQGREHLFASDGSLQWYARQHRRGLVAAGALLMIAGRWHIHAGNFDAYVIEAGAQAAQRQTAAA